MEAVRKPATYEDLLALPEGVRGEIVSGSLVTAPAPLPRHARTAAGFVRRLGGPFDEDDGRGGPGGWWILPEVDVRLGRQDIVRPDLSGWRRERLPAPWNVRPIDVAPDWACEIISPSTASLDMVTKPRLYAAAGIPHYWVVDPVARTLAAYRLQEGQWVVQSFGADETARIAPFDAIELDLSLVFPPELPVSDSAPPAP